MTLFRSTAPLPSDRRALILGLTGSIGSGKSTVSSLLARTGAKVICADTLAREATAPGSEGLRELVALFGGAILDAQGGLDRSKLASIVFKNPDQRRRLEAIVHPHVRARELALLHEFADHPLVVLDVPLLFEAGLDAWCDRIAVVVVSEPVRIERLAESRRMTPQEVTDRLANQMPQQEKADRADIVIDNSGTLDATAEQVNALLRTLFPTGLPGSLHFLPNDFAPPPGC